MWEVIRCGAGVGLADNVLESLIALGFDGGRGYTMVANE